MNPNLKKWLSVAGTTVGGAVGLYLCTALTHGVPTTAGALEALANGAVIAAAGSLIHLFQSPPTAGPVATVVGLFRRGAK